MNEVNKESKEAVMKTLAIIGFIAAILIGLWAAVQVVRFAPTAFSTLASIATGLEGGKKISLQVLTEKNIVNTGEVFTITWNSLPLSGAYTFSYKCTDGVRAEIRNSEGDIASVTCETEIPLAENETKVDVLFESEKRRFIDIPFTIAFRETDSTENTVERKALITVVNASISQSQDIAYENGENAEENENTTDTNTETEGGSAGTPVNTPKTPTPITTTHTFTPVSDPNGTTDLQVSYIGIGELTGEVFTPKAVLDNDVKNALRFEVKNIGTKTSGEWSFTASLPLGQTFTSGTQVALKPNERVVFTLGFNSTEKVGRENIGVIVSGGNDTIVGNNAFSRFVDIVE